MVDKSYQIRWGQLADISAIGEIEHAADRLFPAGRIPVAEEDVAPSLRHTRKPTPPPWGIALLKQALAEDLLFVAQETNKIVGFAVCSIHRRFLHLHQVSVHPDRGRKGIGRALIQTVLAESEQRHLQGVTLTTFSDIPWNAPFYERLGFRVMNEKELSPELRTYLKQEQHLGLVNRVAMIFDNQQQQPAVDYQ